MTLKQTPFELGLLIIHTFFFQVFNVTDNLKAARLPIRSYASTRNLMN